MEMRRSSALIKKKFIGFLLPSILMAFSSSISAIVDGIIVGNMVSAPALAAVNICLPILQIYGTLAVLLGGGAAGRIAVYKGSGEKKKADGIYSAFLLLTVVVSVVLAALQVLFSERICGWLCGDESLLPLVAEYYKYIAPAAPLFIIVSAFTRIIQIEGMEKYAAAVPLLANALNVLFDVLFMGPMKMGITGAALASLIGYAAGFLMIIFYFFSGKKTLGFIRQKPTCAFGEIFSTGIAQSLAGGLLAVKMLFVNVMVIALGGDSGMVTMSLCIAVLQIFGMFVNGVLDAVSPILGISYGEKDISGIRMLIRMAAVVLLGASGAVVLLLETAPQIVPMIYGIADPVQLADSLPVLRIFAAALVGIGLSYLLMFYFAITEKVKLAMTVSVTEGIAAIVPLVLILTKIMGYYGIWTAYVISEFVAPILVLILTKGNVWQFRTADVEPIVFELTLDRSNISDQVKETIEKFRDIAPESANIAGIAIEEMCVNAEKNNLGREVLMDVVIKAYTERLVLSFCDDGREFDPLTYVSDDDQFSFDHIKMLRAISTEMKYQRVIGLNKTNVFFDRVAHLKS